MQLGSTLHMQLWLWNQTPKSLLLRYCPGGCGTTDKHWLAAAQLDFLPVDERDAIMWLRNAEKTAITVVCAYAHRRWATVTGKLSHPAAPGHRKIPQLKTNYRPKF